MMSVFNIDLHLERGQWTWEQRRKRRRWSKL
jgi:hypothetical protein